MLVPAKIVVEVIEDKHPESEKNVLDPLVVKFTVTFPVALEGKKLLSTVDIGTIVQVEVLIVGDGLLNNLVGFVVIVTFLEAPTRPVAVATKIPVCADVVFRK